jgi:formylglycine-generating enzyme required for sulfatase activity
MNSDIRQATAEGAKEIEIRVGPVTFELLRIPPGEFQIGSPEDEAGHKPNEEPQRPIKISKAFYLGRYEVTQAQYQEIMGVNPSLFKGDSVAVDQVLYPQALEFCRKLSQRTGLTITLPTEAQWEYACRAGMTSRFYSGDKEEDLAKVAWYRDNSGEHPHPVGQKPPNAWGLYDMHGNVWEFCLDFIPSYDRVSDTDPVGRTQPDRGAMRGGGWMHPAEYCRSACKLISNDMFGGAGLRIALNPEP